MKAESRRPGWPPAGVVAAYAAAIVAFGYALVSLYWAAGVIHPSGSVDRTALRWHVGLWDLWFLVWGILLALAVAGCRRRAQYRGQDLKHGSVPLPAVE